MSDPAPTRAGADDGADEDVDGDVRAGQLRAGLAGVHARIAAACASAGRPRSDVHLVVVTKTYPARDVRRLVALGVRDVGESREQEAAAKARELAGELAGPAPALAPGAAAADRLRWHFVGQLQRNKAAAVARVCDVVHSVDRARLLAPLARGADEAGRELEVLLQVDVGGAAELAHAPRGGAAGDDLAELADAVAATAGLRLRGLMAVAPRGDPARPAFDRLAAAAARLRADHPAATWLSAGMSGDLEDAVAAGATHLRVGTAVLGRRPPLR